MSIDKEQFQNIATLARLEMRPEEYAESVAKLSKVVDFVDQLSQADTEGVVPIPSLDGLYLVPKVIE